MPIRPSEFDDVARGLAPKLENLPPLVIAIDGRDGAGKTTLGRFLAWYFNVTLVESDLYLVGDGTLNRRSEEIGRIIRARTDARRPVIVDAVGVLQLLEDVGLVADYHIYVMNMNTHGLGGEITAQLARYEKKFAPSDRADRVVKLQHDG